MTPGTSQGRASGAGASRLPAAGPAMRYVVGYGADKRSRDAVRLGVALARAFHAELEIVCVLRTDDPFSTTYPPVGDITPMMRTQASSWLRDAAALVPEDVTARTHIRRSPSVAEGLTDAVQEFHAGMLVVGAAAGKYTAQFSVGPVADTLLHRAPVPVALAPRGYKGEQPITRLYTGVGARPGAQQVLRESQEAVRRGGQELVLLSFLPLDQVADEPHSAIAATETMLRETARTVSPEHPVSVHVATGKNLKRTVTDMDWAPGSVLFVGSSRLAQNRQLFLGTTAARVLRHLPVPMIVLPPAADPAKEDA
ncbi:universal stress protein [Kocuria sp.]|uniref:universal stress protein n=1 Tax=Kocuria sp. TaxID=1871328 RepID=UPI0026DC3DB9|nr:universal stress protein [Kocuria sp.]MDO4917960.1 universal stress protein [Kocuria sp.]